jgi:hypothetical protein
MQHHAEPWTSDDIAKLNQMYWQTERKWSVEAGGFVDLPMYTRSQIAEHFGRSLSAINTQLSRHSMPRENGALPSKAAKMRTCMPCRKPFLSANSGNRICARCAVKIEAGILECA